MAGANLPAKKYKKTAPTVLRLSFEGTGGTTRYIDIARALSIINRKFYRQGVYYYVNSVELYNNEDAFVDLHTLPDNWITKNAWNRGFKIWQKMNAQSDTPRPKYNDFKVLMSTLHTADGANTMDPELFGINSTFSSLAPDEWVYSKFTTMVSNGGASDEFVATMLGTHQGSEHTRDSIGLIKSYQDSRSQPDPSGEPIVNSNIDTDPLANLFDASEDLALRSISDNLDEDNDQTPYDASAYIGHSNNHMQHVARLATSVTTGRVAKASGFCAPFGLICVDPQDTSTAYRVVINLAAGTYHGVYAERA
jgi:hypothetical protein